MAKARAEVRDVCGPCGWGRSERAHGGRLGTIAAALVLLAAQGCQAKPDGPAPPPPLVVARTIPLQGVQGRIDHLAVDLQRKRLFVAELGAGAVESIDLASGRSLGRVTGLKAPQGVAYLPARNELAVASGGDGTVRFYRADDLSPVGALQVGDDADNLRVDPASGELLVGYGSGALAAIDPATRAVRRKAPLPAHPESFRLDAGRAFVNVPDAGSIVTVDLASGREIARWRNTVGRFNFPMALEPKGELLATVFRLPARLALIDRRSGRVVQSLETCRDSDDVFFDPRRSRLYVVCGGGAVDVFQHGDGYSRMARVATRAGSRTGLFVPALDRLFVAARANGKDGAAILELRPAN